jgi:hypothetical protein
VFLTAGLAIMARCLAAPGRDHRGPWWPTSRAITSRAFHEIENVEWPFMLMFFLLAGATLEVHRLAELGLIGLAYVVLRIAARIIGGWIGARLARLPRAERHWIGPALLPQAGVAVGMALVAGEAFPDWRDTIVTLTRRHYGRFRTDRPARDHAGAPPDQGSEHRARIAQDLKPLRRRSREALRHGLAPCAGQFHLRPHAQDLSVVPVGDDQARVLGQKLHREIRIDRPEIPVAPVEIAAPFPVRGIIRPARLALHDPEFTLGAHRHDIEPLAALGREFLQAWRSHGWPDADKRRAPEAGRA